MSGGVNRPLRTVVQTPLGEIDTLSGGSGRTLVVLHRDSGRTEWSRAHQLLARRFHVVAPSLPGFDESPRADWMRTPAHLAYAVADLLASVDGSGCVLLGLGLGAWVAAEALAMSERHVGALVLHAPMGVKPTSEAFLDQFLIAAEDYVKAGFASPSAFDREFGDPVEEQTSDRWERNRETTMRVAWKPYMYNPALPFLLGRLTLPTLVMRGSEDRIVPQSCAERYGELLAAAELATFDGCGHFAELEQPERFAQTVNDFVDRRLVAVPGAA